MISRFDAPSQMTGYVIDFKGNAITVYVTEDGQYMLAGKMFDANGQDVGANELNNYINGAQSEKIWQQLSESSWVLDGNLMLELSMPLPIELPLLSKVLAAGPTVGDCHNVQIRQSGRYIEG